MNDKERTKKRAAQLRSTTPEQRRDLVSKFTDIVLCDPPKKTSNTEKRNTMNDKDRMRKQAVKLLGDCAGELLMLKNMTFGQKKKCISLFSDMLLHEDDAQARISTEALTLFDEDPGSNLTKEGTNTFVDVLREYLRDDSK